MGSSIRSVDYPFNSKSMIRLAFFKIIIIIIIIIIIVIIIIDIQKF